MKYVFIATIINKFPEIEVHELDNKEDKLILEMPIISTSIEHAAGIAKDIIEGIDHLYAGELIVQSVTLATLHKAKEESVTDNVMQEVKGDKTAAEFIYEYAKKNNLNLFEIREEYNKKPINYNSLLDNMRMSPNNSKYIQHIVFIWDYLIVSKSKVNEYIQEYATAKNVSGTEINILSQRASLMPNVDTPSVLQTVMLNSGYKWDIIECSVFFMLMEMLRNTNENN